MALVVGRATGVMTSTMLSDLEYSPYSTLLFTADGQIYIKMMDPNRFSWLDGTGVYWLDGEVAQRHHEWGYALVSHDG